MTEIERKALALVNEVVGSGSWTMTNLSHPYNRVLFQALCRAIEQHEAYKQRVSDAVKGIFIPDEGDGERAMAMHNIRRFIIPKPVDPLVEALKGQPFNSAEIEMFRTAIADGGGRIVFDQPEGGAA